MSNMPKPNFNERSYLSMKTESTEPNPRTRDLEALTTGTVRPNPHFSERSYLRMALASDDGVPNNPSVRVMEAYIAEKDEGGGGAIR